MTNALIIDPRKDPRWDNFVFGHPYGTMYHLSSWCTALNKAFGYEPCYAIIENGTAIQAGLPMMLIKSRLTGNRLVSLPRTSYCDPLAQTKEEMDAMIHAIQFFSSKYRISCIEVKTQYKREVVEGSNFKCYDYFLNQVISLSKDPQEVWKRFHRTSIQQPITKASKAGVKVHFGSTENDLQAFYQLHIKTAHDHAIPPRPLSFFKSIRDAFLPGKLLSFGIAEVEQQPAAASLFFSFRNTIYYEFLGMDYAFIDKSPAHLLLWETIKMACRKGFKCLDYGLSPPDNEGLIEHKRRWGAQARPLGYFYYPDANGYKKFIKGPIGVQSTKHPVIEKTFARIKMTVASKFYRHFG